MTRRISKRVREEAAWICAVCASSDKDGEWSLSTYSVLATTYEARRMAGAAWFAARDGMIRTDTDRRQRYAEAEALLRCGWSP